MYTNGFIKVSFVVDFNFIGLLYNQIGKRISDYHRKSLHHNKREYFIIPIGKPCVSYIFDICIFSESRGILVISRLSNKLFLLTRNVYKKRGTTFKTRNECNYRNIMNLSAYIIKKIISLLITHRREKISKLYISKALEKPCVMIH